MRILVGDVGGTKTRLAIVTEAQGRVHVESVRTLPSGEHANLSALLTASGWPGGERVEAACFGVAGPVRHNRCQVTNLPWDVDGSDLDRHLSLDRVQVINDLEAVGRGLDHLEGGQLVCLNEGEPDEQGNQGIVAPGTGLGEAFRVWNGRRYITRGSEGSHADFAPGNAHECALLAWLQEAHGHVSWERVVSGPGIRTLHRYLVESDAVPCPDWLDQAMRKGDPAAAVVAAARDRSDQGSRDAVEWFLALLGAEAGNHALKVMATGGVYIAGGIPPKMLDFIREGPLLDRFFAKGRMSHLMRRIPVHLVMDDHVALLGAADRALEAARG
jgi:glucokinase